MERKFILWALLLVLVPCCWVYGQDPVRLGGEWVTLPANVNSSSRRGVTWNLGSSVEGRCQVVLQFEEAVKQAQRDVLKGQGVELGGYLMGNAYRALVPAGYSVKDARRVAGLRGVHGVAPAWKLSGRLANLTRGEGKVPAWARVGSDGVRVVVYTASSDWLPSLQESVEKLGGKVAYSAPSLSMLWVDVSRSALLDLAGVAGVSHIDFVSPAAEVNNRTGSALNRVAAVRLPSLYGGRGLTGKGVKVGIWDANVGVHPDLDARVHRLEQELGKEELHGTHVAGSVLGSGMMNERARGMAPQATAYTGNFGEQRNGLPNAVEMIMGYEDWGIRLTQNSYGIPLMQLCEEYELVRLYMAADYSMDLLACEYPTMVHVVAAGNDQHVPYCDQSLLDYWGTTRYGTSTWQAKNLIYVGAVDEDGKISDFSSLGPLVDGRLFPTVCAKGVAVESCIPGGDYMPMDGTSMACPQTSGAVALMKERYHQLHLGEELRSDLCRGVMANTARDAGRKGPDFEYGYGIFDLERSLQVLEKGWYALKTLKAGGEEKFTITVPEGVDELRVMLVWNDPYSADQIGTEAGVKLLQNDLDLSVTYGGQSYLPWVCDATKGNVEKLAERKKDDLNTQEQVTIENPNPGTVEVSVSGKGITQEQQSYALVWYFEKNEPRIVYPQAGMVLSTGEVEALVVEGLADDYHVELSLDGGTHYLPNEQHAHQLGMKYRKDRLYIPADASLTDKLRIRVYDAKHTLETAPEIILAPRVQGVRLESGVCNCDGMKLKWDAVAQASEGYVVLQGDVKSESFKEVSRVKDATEISLPSLTSDELSRGVVYSVCVLLPDGTYGPRALGVQPTGVESPMLPEDGKIKQEHFVQLPVRSVGVQRKGEYITSDWSPTPSGREGEHDLLLRAVHSAKDLTASFDNSDQQEWTTSLRICVPDMQSLKADETMAVTFYGFFRPDDYEGLDHVAFRALDNAKPLTDLRGRQIVTAADDFGSLESTYILQGGQKHELTIEVICAENKDLFVLSSIEFARNAEFRNPILLLEDHKKQGANLKREEFTLRVKNLALTPVEKGLVFAEVNGVADPKSLLHVDNIAPGELRSFELMVDLSTTSLFGEMKEVVFVFRDMATGYEHRVKAEVENLGNMLLHPAPIEAMMMHSVVLLNPYATETVKGSMLYSDMGGLRGEYRGEHKSTLRLVPLDSNEVVELTIRKLSLAENSELNVYTEHLPYVTKQLMLKTSYESENGQEVWQRPVDVLKGDASGKGLPLHYVSHDPTGGIVLHFVAGEEEGAGWEAEIRSVPRTNVLSLLEAKAQSVGASPSSKLDLELTLFNHHSEPIDEVLVQVQLGDRSSEYKNYTLRSVPSGKSTMKIDGIIADLEEAVVWMDGRVLISCERERDYRDNASSLFLVKDVVPQVPSFCKDKGVRLDYLSFGEGESVMLPSEGRTSLPLHMKEKWVMSEHWNRNVKAEFSSVSYDMHLSVWADANANNEMEKDEMVSVMVPKESSDATLALPLPLGATDKSYRVRFYFGGSELSIDNASRGHYWEDIVDGYVTLSNELVHDDLELVSVSYGKSGSNLSNEQVVTVELKNAGRAKDYEGKCDFTVTPEHTSALSEEWIASAPVNGSIDFSGNPLPVGESREYEIPGVGLDFSQRGFHRASVTLKEVDADKPNTDNNSQQGRAIFSVVDQDNSPKYLRCTPAGGPFISFDQTMSEELSTISDAFTLECWVYPEAGQAQYLFHGDDFYWNICYEHSFASVTDYSLECRDKRGDIRVFSDGACVKPNQWNHIALSHDKGTLQFYVNGVAVPMKSKEFSFSMGNLSFGEAGVVGGVDHIRLWSKALDAASIKGNMYKSVRSTQGDLPADCVAEFAFTEGEGNYLATSGKHYVNVMTSSEALLLSGAGESGIWQKHAPLIESVRVAQGGRLEKGTDEWVITFPADATLTGVEMQLSSLWPGVSFTVNDKPFADGKGVIDFQDGQELELKGSLTHFMGHENAVNGFVTSCKLRVVQEKAWDLKGVTFLAGKTSGLQQDVSVPVSSTMELEQSAGLSSVDPSAVVAKFEVEGDVSLYVQGEPVVSLDEVALDLTRECRFEVRPQTGAGEKVYILKLRKQQEIDANSFASLLKDKLVYGAKSVDLKSVSSTSGLPVRFASSDEGVVTVVDGSMHVVGVGEAIVTALQPGDTRYLAATPVEQKVVVQRKQVTLTPESATIAYGEKYELKHLVEGAMSEEHEKTLPFAEVYFEREGEEYMPHGVVNGEMDDADLFLRPGVYEVKATRSTYETNQYSVTCLPGELRVEPNANYTYIRLVVLDEKGPVEDAIVKVGGFKLLTDGEGVIEFASLRDAILSYSVICDGYLPYEGGLYAADATIEHLVHLKKAQGMLTYVASEGGVILGTIAQALSDSQQPTPVVAVANPGYLFEKWNDGLTSANRHDADLQSGNHEYTASFKPLTFTVTYEVQPGGSLTSGQASYSLKYGEKADPVTVEPSAGYYFVGWSDGNSDPSRQGDLVQGDAKYVARIGKVQDLPYSCDFSSPDFSDGWHAYTQGDFSIMWEVGSKPLGSNGVHLDDAWAYCFSGKNGSRYGNMDAYLLFPQLNVKGVTGDVMVSYDYILTVYAMTTEGDIDCNLEYSVDGINWQPLENGMKRLLPCTEKPQRENLRIAHDAFASSDVLHLRFKFHTVTDYYVLVDNVKVAEQDPATVTYSYAVEPSGAGKLNGEDALTKKYALHAEAEEVTAVPENGYRFVKWKENGNTNPVYAGGERVNADRTFTALFEKADQHHVFLSVYPQGAGVVKQGADALNADFTWSGDATIEAVASKGYAFAYWSANGSKEASLKLTSDMHGERIVAYFDAMPVVYRLLIKGDGGEPVSDALVSLGSQQAKSDKDGAVSFTLSVGNYALSVSAPEYTSFNSEVEISSEGEQVIQLYRSYYNLVFKTDGHGKLEGETYQRVAKGGTSSPVVVVPLESDWVFSHWNDGEKQAERTIMNVQQSGIFEAIFVQQKNGSDDSEGSNSSTPVELIASEARQLQCYPNPTSGELFIKNCQQGDATIYTLEGVSVLSIPLQDGSLDCSALTPGLYFVRVITSDGTVMVGKVVKR